MRSFLSKNVLSVSLISSVGVSASVSASVPMDYKVVDDELTAEEECMQACSLLGKDFDNLENQNRVRNAFAKVKECQSICDDYFYNKLRKPFGEYDTYGKYADLKNRLHSLKAPWWAITRSPNPYKTSIAPWAIGLVRTKSQDKALDFILKLDQEGPNATHMNLWYG